jgi:hypothetical protein
MRSLYCASLALVICSATLLADTLYTKRKTNELREGAGAYYSLIGSVPENTPLSVIARSGPWVKVQTPNKHVGWIAANCLTEEKNDRMITRSLETLWSSPKALAAAIKGFGKKYVKGTPGVVDSVLRSSEKNFTKEDLAAFAKEIRQYPSRNRDRLQIEDLKLATPQYYANLPEQQIGVGIASRIAGKGMLNNEPLHRYMNMVCATIVENSSIYDWDLTVLVLNDTTINAFAVPGGHIFVTLGLVLQCRDESELAGIIAHEIAHIYRRHGLQEMSKRIVGIHADIAFGELAEEVEDTTKIDEEMETIAEQTYERIVHPRLLAYETEADKIGALLVANAGYDPFGLVRISEQVARVSTEKPDIFDPDYMLPNDALARSKEIRAFSEKHFTVESPGERMSQRFLSVTSPWR